MPDTRLIRLLDADFNRAREALRVLEEAARFLLDDAVLTAAAKDMRHRLTSAAMSLPGASQFSLDRDTPGDVGTPLTTPNEETRAALLDVINSAFGRASEALRALEEYSKLLGARHSGLSTAVAAGAQFKQLRYEAYTLHTNLVRRLQPRTALSRLRLYVLITADLCRGDWLAVAEQALAGGADCLQLREKNLDDAELLRRAQALAALCHRYNALFIMNDRPDIALLAGADGVHLGQDDLPVAAARRILGHDAIIGKSTHTLEQALAAAEEAPDYIAVGQMFQSATKPQDHIAGIETLRQIAAQVKVPLVAIGGITLDNASEILAAGAQAVAVCQAVIGRPDAISAAEAFRANMHKM